MKTKTIPSEKIKDNLIKALLLNGEMNYGLYEYELKEHINFWKEGMRKDKDEFIFVITENNGDVAMLLLDKKGKLFINEEARGQLQLFWNFENSYQKNIEFLLPLMITLLLKGEIFVNGVKFTKSE